MSTKFLVFFLLSLLLSSPFLFLHRPHALFHVDDASTSFLSPARVLLVTAHPDDECLFFGPTILALRRDRTNAGETGDEPNLHALCLSVGDADGLGQVRREEYHRSLDVLGVTKENRWVLDHPDLKDNITVEWDPTTIASVVQPFITALNITTILTFDSFGISQHPNHRSLPNGIRYLLASHPTPKPKLYALVTVSLIQKYTGTLTPLWMYLQSTLLSSLHHLRSTALFNSPQTLPLSPPHPSIPSEVKAVFISGSAEFWTAVNAMRQHRSQLVWFRHLYVAFSRYMWINEWTEIDA